MIMNRHLGVHVLARVRVLCRCLHAGRQLWSLVPCYSCMLLLVFAARFIHAAIHLHELRSISSLSCVYATRRAVLCLTWHMRASVYQHVAVPIVSPQFEQHFLAATAFLQPELQP